MRARRVTAWKTARVALVLGALALAAACRSGDDAREPAPPKRPEPRFYESGSNATNLAPTQLDRIRRRGRLVVLDRGEDAGVHRDPANGARRKLELALARALAKKILGDEAKLDACWARRVDRVPALASGAVDLATVPIAATDETRLDLDFSTPWGHDEPALLVAKSGVHFQELAQLAGKTVSATTESGRFLGEELERRAAEGGFAVTVRAWSTFDEAAADVREKRADGLLGLASTIGARLAAHPDEGDLVTGLFPREALCVGVRRGERDLRGLVDETLAELRASGELARIAADARFPAANLDLR